MRFQQIGDITMEPKRKTAGNDWWVRLSHYDCGWLRRDTYCTNPDNGGGVCCEYYCPNVIGEKPCVAETDKGEKHGI